MGEKAGGEEEGSVGLRATMGVIGVCALARHPGRVQMRRRITSTVRERRAARIMIAVEDFPLHRSFVMIEGQEDGEKYSIFELRIENAPDFCILCKWMTYPGSGILIRRCCWVP